MPSMALNKLLQRLAIEVDPEKGRWPALAQELDVHTRTMWMWRQAGKVPPLRARDINRRFGDTLAPMKVLTGGKKNGKNGKKP